MRIKRSIWIPFFLVVVFSSGCSSPAKTRYESSAYNEQRSNDVIKTARSLLGRPYRYGGRSPKTGFDCSGLVYYSYQQAGVELPRSSKAQYLASVPVSRRAIKRGDLLFFRINRRKISHVGIYIGNQRFIHAPSSGKEVSIETLDAPYWSERFARAGRIIQN